MFQCPACGELMEILTNFHCTSQHSMTKERCIELYGSPKYVTAAMNREVQNWIRAAAVVTKLDFDVAQAAGRSQLKRG